MRKKLSVFCAALIVSLLSCGIVQAVTLPENLQTVDEDAFSGTALSGVVTLPNSVKTIGDHVFDQSDIYALIVPGTVSSMGVHNFGEGMAYVMYTGFNDTTDNLSGMRYLFCAQSIDRPNAICLEQLITDGLFWYQIVEGPSLMVLCAVDNLAMPTQVIIPSRVESYVVRALAEDFLIGCDQVTDIVLPCTVTDVNPRAFSSRTDVHVSRPDLEIWWNEWEDDVNRGLLEGFLAIHPEYSDWKITTTFMGAGDAAYYVCKGISPDVYIFAQDRFASLLQSSGLAEVPASYYSAVLDDDAAAIAAASLDGRLLAYPITSDNGYFLYYDQDIITNPDDLDIILSNCEQTGCTFYMDLTSGWYNISFFFGAGCELRYDYKNDIPVAFYGNLASENGLKALKAMIKVASSPAFRCGSSAENADADMAAIISGTWDVRTITERFSHHVATKMPKISGFQLGSFGGFELIGVKDNGNSEHLAAAHALAAWLSSVPAQVQRQNAVGWMASDPQARAQANTPWYFMGLAAQMEYARPQGLYPVEYWDIAEALGTAVISGELNDLSDTELMEVLQQYQNDLAALVQ